MSVKIRLQRQGRKRKPYYHIVVADVRAPRDGRYIERLGFYNPNTDPATIDIDVDKSVDWLKNGAQPTDTCRAILSYKGVMYKHHLVKGVAKGALAEEEVEKRFNAWLEEKANKVQAKRDRLANESDTDKKARQAAEAKVREERAAAIAAKNSPVAEEAEATAEAEAETAEAPEAAATEEVTAEVEATAEEPKAEPEAPATEEAKEEAPAEEEEKKAE